MSEWVWLVDESVEPEEGARDRLLAALEDLGPLPAPALLACRVVTPEGTLDGASLPVPDTRDPERLVVAFERRLMPIRVARPGAMLVRDVPSDDPLVWTTRLLRDELGLLVPAAVAVRRRPASGSEAGALLRLLLSDALEPRERPWFAVRLAEAALGGRRAARAGSR